MTFPSRDGMLCIDTAVGPGDPIRHLMELSDSLSETVINDPGDGLGRISGMPLIKLTAILFEYMVADAVTMRIKDTDENKPLARERLGHYRGLIATILAEVIRHKDTLRSELQCLGKDIENHPFSCILEMLEHVHRNTH